MFLTQSPYIPDARLVLELFQRKRYERLRRRAENGRHLQWFLLYGQAGKDSLLNPQPARLQTLFPPEDRIWADPFLWKHGEDFFIFCEEYFFSNPRGRIVVLPLGRDGRFCSSSQPVLEKPFHLSYPFLFEYGGTLHMMPEGGHGGAIDVYECEEFPLRWGKRATLMRGIQYVDATLFEHQGKWWLFLTQKKGVFALNRDLFVFWADSPLSEHWTPHPCNPVIRGLTSARPAGPIFEVGGKLYRPAQNCLVRYGHSLRINEIERLDTKGYRERLTLEIRPDWQPDIKAVHHINWRAGMLIMDAQRLLPAVNLLG